MIIFNLECKLCSVKFEGWFENTNEFEKQRKQKIINCPSCNSSSITKALMTPNVSKKSNSKDKKIKKTIATKMSKYKKIIEENFSILDFSGLVYNPLNHEWRLSKNNKLVNYFCTARLN